MDLHDLGGKHINVWVANSAGMETLGRAGAENGGFSNILYTNYGKETCCCKPVVLIYTLKVFLLGIPT